MGRSTVNPIWEKIWRLSGPTKVKIFISRTVHGTLPCRVTLANRHMKISPIFPTCSEGLEDTKHLLFLCSKAQEVWKRLAMDIIIGKACEIDRAGEAVLEYLLLLPDQELRIMGCHNVREMIAILAWYLWWERRKLVHKEKIQNAHMISIGILALTTSFVHSSSPKASMRREGWSYPHRGFVKLNVDASFDHDLLWGTMGAVLRVGKGRFIARGNNTIDHCADVLMAEVLALKFGLTLEQKVRCNRLIINSDNMEVIETMKDGGRSAGSAAAIFDDCFHYACNFVATKFEHRNREANKVAHELVRLARFSRASDWFEESPVEVVTLLLNDVLIISNE
ncbi:hypothetical protein ZWY2020_033946 [Hordeum vulgare]|nr:hypothetical protein ZWY2020_033946 [Hordeum vulgare]